MHKSLKYLNHFFYRRLIRPLCAHFCVKRKLVQRHLPTIHSRKHRQALLFVCIFRALDNRWATYIIIFHFMPWHRHLSSSSAVFKSWQQLQPNYLLYIDACYMSWIFLDSGFRLEKARKRNRNRVNVPKHSPELHCRFPCLPRLPAIADDILPRIVFAYSGDSNNRWSTPVSTSQTAWHWNYTKLSA